MAADTRQMILEAKRTVSPARIELPFTVPPFSVEHQVRLSLMVRIDSDDLGGSNPWIRVLVNGNALTKTDLLNKRDSFVMLRGLDLTWSKGDRWRVLYSPDFEAALRRDHPNACPDADPYRYVWDITSHVRPGANNLAIEHLKILAEPSTLVLKDVAVEVGRPISPPPAETVAPAPTGPVPTYVAAEPDSPPITVALSRSGALILRAENHTGTIDTRTSLPRGKWYETGDPDDAIPVRNTADATWTTPAYDVTRRVHVTPDHVHVADSFRNTTDQLIGIMVEHRVNCEGKPNQTWLAGRERNQDRARTLNPYHPSAFARWGDAGLGIVAEDDVFRVHVTSFREPDCIGLADHRLGIPPGGIVTLEWSLYPVPGGDYWDFVNAVRRNWDANFTIPGAFCFGMHFPTGEPASWYADWMHQRDLKITAGGIAKYTNGRYAHGTGITEAPEFVAQEREWIGKMRSEDPQLTALCYFHAQCCTEPEAETKYADSRLIDADGNHLSYPYAYPLPLYLPTATNNYGKALWRYVNTCLDTIGASGLYWDEMTHSVLWYAYDAPWDGCTVTMDPKTHDVTGKQTSVPLAMQALKLDIVHTLRNQGKFLLANTQPATRTMLREKIVRFVETGTYSAVIDTHLACPIGLGNHHPENTQADRARNVREILERGAVYYGHHYRSEPVSWNFNAVMFPITPVELHAGVVLGKERIHTARSGRFGWPDGAPAAVYVVDADGARIPNPSVSEISDDGKLLYEIRMPSDHFAILVRQDAQH